MDAEQLAEVVKEIEDEKALNRVSGVEVFRSMINQPDLLVVSSANATATTGTNGYTQFTVNLPRPVLEVDTLQLLSANIPLCTQNFPDTSIVFWYYRLNVYNAPVPSTENLFFVRLLPSYYKPEFFQKTPDKYGQNITFGSYAEVAPQLALACANDLCYTNIFLTLNEWAADGVSYQPQFRPSDVSITFNSALNKFQLTGLNTEMPLFAIADSDTWLVGTTYDLGDYVTYDGGIYRSLVAGNIGHQPYTGDAYGRILSQGFWGYVSAGLVREFSSTTPYYAGQYVVYPAGSSTIVQAVYNNYGAYNSADWEVPQQTTGPYNIRYLSAGYGDPNIPLNQGTGYKQWSPYALFESGILLQYQGSTYQAYKQSKGFTPFYIPKIVSNPYDSTISYAVGQYVYFYTTTSWYVCVKAFPSPNPFSLAVRYNVGQYVFYSNYWYICIVATTGNYPSGTTSDNTYWKYVNTTPTSSFWSPIEFSATKTNYAPGDLITWSGDANILFWKCIATPPAQASPIVVGGYFNTNPYWIPSLWTPITNTINLPTIGLNAISSRFDMIDAISGVPEFPFPIGIPGQPFNPTPRRTLNSLLGFTWNGVYNPLAVSAVLQDINVPNGSTTTDVLNRIRPVPFYVSYGAAGLLTTGASTTALIYTADGYANLVYSSIISIYANVVYGSTLDTQRNTSLLGLSSLNAGNLGVSYYLPYIDNNLKINRGDLYAITLELRDECSEPYPLTNNGIATFSLKLTYKERKEENKEK